MSSKRSEEIDFSHAFDDAKHETPNPSPFKVKPVHAWLNQKKRVITLFLVLAILIAAQLVIIFYFSSGAKPQSSTPIPEEGLRILPQKK